MNDQANGNTSKRTVISLFAGIGGFDIGFTRAGFEIVAHVEKDANCRKLLASKWPAAVALDDVCTAGAHNLPPCDVITFGFPCQDLSVAGKRAGLAGGRSGLYYEATRIINELKPAYCLFENVPGLLSSDGGRDFARVLMEMDRIGYHGAWRVLDAQWLGVAQRRRRVFGLFSRLDSGAERCAEILSLQESLCGHPAPRRETGQGATYSVAPCLAASGGGTERTGETRGQDCVIPAVAGCLSPGAHPGGCDGQAGNTPGHLVPVAFQCKDSGDSVENVSPTLRSLNSAESNISGGGHVAVAFGGDVARTLNARHDSSPCADRGMDVVAVPVAMRESGQGYWMEDDKAGTLRGEGENRPSRPSNVIAQVQWASGGGKVHNPTAQALRSNAEHNYQFAQMGMQVRRLTPTECERLQGFPDGHTAGFSDSTRYKMLGNAVCVNVAEWIARRLKNPA
jgi:DNA (cytosine-5)-methyltransferase 1